MGVAAPESEGHPQGRGAMGVGISSRAFHAIPVVEETGKTLPRRCSGTPPREHAEKPQASLEKR
jgi:hypothetical protein